MTFKVIAPVSLLIFALLKAKREAEGLPDQELCCTWYLSIMSLMDKMRIFSNWLLNVVQALFHTAVTILPGSC